MSYRNIYIYLLMYYNHKPFKCFNNWDLATKFINKLIYFVYLILFWKSVVQIILWQTWVSYYTINELECAFSMNHNEIGIF